MFRKYKTKYGIKINNRNYRIVGKRNWRFKNIAKRSEYLCEIFFLENDEFRFIIFFLVGYGSITDVQTKYFSTKKYFVTSKNIVFFCTVWYNQIEIIYT